MSRQAKDDKTLRLECTIERKNPRLPRFVVVPTSKTAGWKLAGTTVVETALNGVAIGRRSLKRWDKDRWFIELAQPMCEKAAVDTGDRLELELRLASEELPEELAALVARGGMAGAAWAQLTVAQQRMLREEVLAARTPEGRKRRAQHGLGVLSSAGRVRRRRTRG